MIACRTPHFASALERTLLLAAALAGALFTLPAFAEEARLIYRSDFEAGTALARPALYGNGAWQEILRADVDGGLRGALRGRRAADIKFQLIAGDSEHVTPVTLPGYMYNQIRMVAGPGGRPTRALYSVVLKGAGGADTNWDSTQNSFVLFPRAGGRGDVYVSYWLKLQADLLARMTVNKWAGRVVSDWKTGVGEGNNGDFRIVLSIFGDGVKKRLYWNLRGDNRAGRLPERVYWDLSNKSFPVPTGEWFRVEVYVHRSVASEGRVWVAINGHTLFDHHGSNVGIRGLPWNRIMASLNYSSGQLLPAYQWLDDLEVWSGVPATASLH